MLGIKKECQNGAVTLFKGFDGQHMHPWCDRKWGSFTCLWAWVKCKFWLHVHPQRARRSFSLQNLFAVLEMPVTCFSQGSVCSIQTKVVTFLLQIVTKLLMMHWRSGDTELFSLLCFSPTILLWALAEIEADSCLSSWQCYRKYIEKNYRELG